MDAVHAVGPGQRVDPVRYQGSASHRQKRLGGPDQVSEPPAAVGHHIPLQPGPVPGGKNHGFHRWSGAEERMRGKVTGRIELSRESSPNAREKG